MWCDEVNWGKSKTITFEHCNNQGNIIGDPYISTGAEPFHPPPSTYLLEFDTVICIEMVCLTIFTITIAKAFGSMVVISAAWEYTGVSQLIYCHPVPTSPQREHTLGAVNSPALSPRISQVWSRIGSLSGDLGARSTGVNLVHKSKLSEDNMVLPVLNWLMLGCAELTLLKANHFSSQRQSPEVYWQPMDSIKRNILEKCYYLLFEYIVS